MQAKTTATKHGGIKRTNLTGKRGCGKLHQSFFTLLLGKTVKS